MSDAEEREARAPEGQGLRANPVLSLLKSWKDRFVLWVLKIMFRTPWDLAVLALRLQYRFRLEGAENIPAKGPFILVIREPSLIGVLVCGWITIVVRLQVLGRQQRNWMSYMQENLLVLPYFRQAMNIQAFGRMGGLLDHSAGRMALGLLDGYRVLTDGGLVGMNPFGEGSWDGRSRPIGRSLAWLGLHTATPLLPAVCSIGAYEIWPRWASGPSRKGRLVMHIGQPFTLCDSPMQQVSDEEIDAASEQITAVLDSLCYGPGGIPDWMGPVLQDGKPQEQPVQIRRKGHAQAAAPPSLAPGPVGQGEKHLPVWRRGLAQLLWRCPVCCTNDALIHARPRLRTQTLHCGTCSTDWQLQQVVGKDFRLKVVEGPPDLVGLDMPLSAWYDEMKRDFQPDPIPVSGLDLLPDEETYLEASGIALSPYQPSPLFEGWSGREPPQTQPPTQPDQPDWASLGEGRCILTSCRLVWQGEDGELDFYWSHIRAIHLWLVKTLGLNYGTARYRFGLGQEVGLKWLTYLGTLAQQAADEKGHKIAVTPF